MLAGVHGLDAVMLVVAADEGVMPQTVEHLEIVHLLEVNRGLVALTKVDLVEDEWLALVTEEVVEKVNETALRGAPLVRVSSVTEEGVDELKEQLDRVLESTPEKADRGRPRLPIDRVFTISGFGTVVTGTLVEGRLAVGEELEAVPSGRRVRIRGLQQHNQKVEVALPGTRVAANLAGVEREELGRGDVLARPGLLARTRRIDAFVSVLSGSGRRLRHGAQLTLHTGTVEVPARVIVLEGGEIEPGADGWAQLFLDRPVAAAAGDRFVLRLPSPSMTIGGGRFADVAPHRHPRHDSGVRQSLERRVAGSVLQEELRKYPRGVTVEALLKATLSERAELDKLEARKAGGWLFSPESWARISERARLELSGYHSAHPLRPGMPREELKSRLGLQPAAVAPVLAELAREAVVVERDGVVALPGHEVKIDTAAEGPAARLVELLARQPFAPPSLSEAMRDAGAGPEVLRALIQRGEVVRLSEDVGFARGAYDRAVQMVRDIVESEGSVTVASLRDRMSASRRPVLALLEHLDAERVTRRVGDLRVLR
jgi:selenocysteine-specific elongation factor